MKNGFFCSVDENGMLHRKGIIVHTDEIRDCSALQMLIYNEMSEIHFNLTKTSSKMTVSSAQCMHSRNRGCAMIPGPSVLTL